MTNRTSDIDAMTDSTPNIVAYNKTEMCHCVGTHTPAAYVGNYHHIIPQSWGGQTVPANQVWLCGNTHAATHDLLNQYIHHQGVPPESVLLHYTELSRELAAQAWAQRPSDHPPYTNAHP